MFSPSSKSPSGPPSFLWTFPECPVRIHVHFQLIDRLRSEIADSASGGREVGGLLIGDVLPETGDIEIYDYYRLPSSSESSGNFVVCSEALTRAIQSWREPHRKVVGFYRTHLEQRLNLRDEDLECIQSKFNDPMNVFLLIRSHDGRTSAGFFFWQDAAVVGGLTFPFSSTELSSSGWTTLLGGPPKDTHPRIPFERVRHTAWQVASGGRIGLFLAVAILIAMAIALRVYLPSSGARQTLGLRLERALLGVVVAWNPSAPEVATAKDADLIIWDGSSPATFLRLTPAQLRTGRTFLTSISDRVEVRLDVIGAEGTARTESVVSVSRAPQGSPVQIPAATRAPVPRRPAPRADVASALPAQKPPQEIAQANAPGTPAAEVRTEPGASPDAAGKASEPARPQTAPVQTESPMQGPFEPAVPVRETRPEVPSELQPLIQTDNVVEVQVRINAAGKVTDARTAGLRGPLASLLSKSAVDAARGWQFRPATHGGAPVPSEKTLEFLFRAAAR